MNTVQFNAAGLEDMTFAEMQETDGGGPIGKLLRSLTIGGIVASIIEHWDDIEKGWEKGCAQANARADAQGLRHH